VDLATAIGYCGSALVFLTFATKTMVPLRILGIASNVFFIAYGYLQPAVPILLLHCVLLPLNALRLHQMLRLIRQVAEAAKGDLNLDWLKPLGSPRRVKAGELLFRKGAPADRMAFVLSGRFRIAALNIELGPGQMVGEHGLTSPDGIRTQTVECTEEGEVLEITYDLVKQLYFQNPKFGFYFLELTTRRLFENIAKLESQLACAAPNTTPEASGKQHE
jgi:CRP-like cAMP-binding protein